MFQRAFSRFGQTACLALSLALAGAFAPTSAPAQVVWSSVDEVISVEVVPGWRRADGTHVAGLQFSLEAGWKTYWRSAGAAGIPPNFDWDASEQLDDVAVVWPAPRVFRQGGVQSIGYDQDFILPLILTPTDAQGPVRLSGVLDLGVCADICLPARLQVDATLPTDAQPNAALQAALNSQPQRLGVPVNCSVRSTPDGLALSGQVDLPALGGVEAVVFEVPDPKVWVTDADVQRQGDRLFAQSELMVAGGEAAALNTSDVRITVIGGNTAVELAGCG
ncbi:MAG: protein-disulfide reductase DsbD domain-containing protein [Pseudomonadota bacterium]